MRAAQKAPKGWIGLVPSCVQVPVHLKLKHQEFASCQKFRTSITLEYMYENTREQFVESTQVTGKDNLCLV